MGSGCAMPGPAAHAPFACEDRQQRNDAEPQGDAQQHRGGESNAGRGDTVCRGVDHREQREAGTVRDPPQVPRTSIVTVRLTADCSKEQPCADGRQKTATQQFEGAGARRLWSSVNA
jgi:hypothetical protein